ncbi:MAG: hypothetical protein PHW14_06170, partial [Candidatus Omnitrophica bacterium]|nr:hypothetical protein [Candidatus Omnitrophota bacterium]
MKKVLILIQALFLAFFLAASAAAEAVPQGGKEDPLPLNTDNSGMGTATPQVSLRNAAPYLTGDWGGLRPEFKEKGYTLSSSYVFDVLGNVSGGMERRTVYTHSWGTDIEVDMEKAFGLKGGIFHT